MEPGPVEVDSPLLSQCIGVVIVVVLGSASPVSHDIKSPSSIDELDYHVDGKIFHGLKCQDEL